MPFYCSFSAFLWSFAFVWMFVVEKLYFLLFQFPVSFLSRAVSFSSISVFVTILSFFLRGAELHVSHFIPLP
jgi:hypothetical protein